MRSEAHRIFLSGSLALLTILFAVPALAGSISISWNPVADTDLAGYRVYYGTSPNSYSQNVDVGNVTSKTLTGLTDCTTWYVAVKAYDTTGNLSTTYSNEISGWPRPTLTSSNPTAAEQGRTLSLTLAGSNFQSGATVQFANGGVTVNSVTVNSCTQLTVNVTVGAAAATGAGNVDVTNTDQVFGTGTGVFTVQAAAAPTVASTAPIDGATGVAVTVKPAVTFSEAMLGSSITSATIKLLDDTGAAVAQGAGSPALSSNGLTATITPLANLAMGKTYKIQVVGGASGAKDLANHPVAATYTQTTGFSTAGDTTAPVITAVASSNVTATTAKITWTTDEAADSQVFYRKTGETAYQQTAVNATDVTSHSLDLAGLSPQTGYEYYVRSVDAADNAAQSSPNKNFTTPSNAFTYLRFEAEGGDLVAPVRSQTGAGTFGGAYIDTPAGTAAGSASAPAGTANFGFNVPSTGSWSLWLLMYGPAGSSNSWFEAVDGATRQAVTTPTNGEWVWVEARTYTLTSGLHDLELGGREAQARIDRVLITDDPTFTPTEQAVGDQTPPAAASSFSATAGDGQNSLSWTNPGSDYSKTVLRYRTDGQYPVSPVDGFTVTTKSGTAGGADSFVHGSLTNGTTYFYSAFALDAAGNVSTAAKTSATPQTADLPPAQVTGVQRTDVK
jgi:hypothetical protein